MFFSTKIEYACSVNREHKISKLQFLEANCTQYVYFFHSLPPLPQNLTPTPAKTALRTRKLIYFLRVNFRKNKNVVHF